MKKGGEIAFPQLYIAIAQCDKAKGKTRKASTPYAPLKKTGTIGYPMLRSIVFVCGGLRYALIRVSGLPAQIDARPAVGLTRAAPSPFVSYCISLVG